MSTKSESQYKTYQNRTSRRVNQIPPSGIRKFFDLLASVEGVISLGVGEPDYATPWHICETAIYSLEKGYTMYTSNSGMPELRHEPVMPWVWPGACKPSAVRATFLHFFCPQLHVPFQTV